uniref:protein kinase domain-containing protein n=1 Tax=Gordonia sp. B7-2 TaxID=3420932 RepID=UPI003D91A526
MMRGLDHGDEFAGYRIVRRIGVGGMGEVYLANHPRLPRQDALKVLAPMFQHDRQFRERFGREADVAAALVHPNIVPIHDRGEHEDRLWISMAFIEGSDAAAVANELDGGVLPVELVLEIATAVADALDHAHENGLLHRDVKPGNILVTRGRRRRVYLADFGIAKMQDAGLSLTASGMFIGSLAYSAPEQIAADSQLTSATDQYQLACTVFELLVGSPPFRSGDLAAVLHQHLTAPPPRLSDHRSDIPRAVDDVFARALSKEAASRFACCADFVDALAAAMSARPDPPTASQRTVRQEPAARTMVVEDHSGSAPNEWIRATVLSGRAGPQGGELWRPGIDVARSSNPAVPYGQPAGRRLVRSRVPHPAALRRGLACGLYFALTATEDPVDDMPLVHGWRRLNRQLRSTWGLNDDAAVIEMADSLNGEGDAARFDPALAAVHASARSLNAGSRQGLERDWDRIASHAVNVPLTVLSACVQVIARSGPFPDRVPTSVLAWDISRSVILLRYLAHQGHIDMAGAVARISEVGRMAAATYPSWQAYAAGFEVGRALALADGAKRPVGWASGSLAETRPVIVQLLNDPDSPWLEIPLRDGMGSAESSSSQLQ